MAHCVTALIAQSPVVESLLQGHPLVAADLRDGWRLVPLENDDLDSLGLDFSQVRDGFNYLSPPCGRKDLGALTLRGLPQLSRNFLPDRSNRP